MNEVLVQVIVGVVTAAAGYWLRHSQGDGAAPAGGPGNAAIDLALDLVAKRWPAVKPVVLAIEKAEHDGALERLRAVLTPPAK